MTRAMDWKALLIGGGSGTGKTELAYALGKHYDVPVVEGDLLRHVIEAAVPEAATRTCTPSRTPASGSRTSIPF